MATSDDELTLDELLSDPVTRAVMKADRVDPSALGAELRSMAGTIEQGFDRTKGFIFEADSAQSRCAVARSRIRSELCGAP
jgi:hypothetical protein